MGALSCWRRRNISCACQTCGGRGAKAAGEPRPGTLHPAGAAGGGGSSGCWTGAGAGGGVGADRAGPGSCDSAPRPRSCLWSGCWRREGAVAAVHAPRRGARSRRRRRCAVGGGARWGSWSGRWAAPAGSSPVARGQAAAAARAVRATSMLPCGPWRSWSSVLPHTCSCWRTSVVASSGARSCRGGWLRAGPSSPRTAGGRRVARCGSPRSRTRRLGPGWTAACGRCFGRGGSRRCPGATIWPCSLR